MRLGIIASEKVKAKARAEMQAKLAEQERQRLAKEAQWRLARLARPLRRPVPGPATLPAFGAQGNTLACRPSAPAVPLRRHHVTEPRPVYAGVFAAYN